jgi:MoaA/NifB/PqqE/SkfB family radical SAM enzyme
VAEAPGPGRLPDFSRAPLTVAWEITRACPLRCLHCRADAQTRRDGRELTTAEGRDLIGQVADMGAGVLVVTGGDPLARPDVFELIAAGARAGLHVGFSPSVTPRLTSAALARAVDAGAATIHLSLDGATAATHDGFRGVPGSFARTLRMIDEAAALPVRLQVGTTVAVRTVGDLPRIPPLLAGKVESWTLFFCVPTGRAGAGDVLDAAAHERVLTWLACTPLPVPVRMVAAPTFRRVLAQLRRPVTGPPVTGPPVNDGRGFCFVSGEVCPSGFLQIPVGNVRERPLAEWYRDHPLFRALRDPGRLAGRCGRCPYGVLCGGSRARAWAMSGDPLGEDPTCAFDPDAAPAPLPSSAPA